MNRQMMELSKACSPFINGVDPPALLSLLFSFFFLLILWPVQFLLLLPIRVVNLSLLDVIEPNCAQHTAPLSGSCRKS